MALIKRSQPTDGIRSLHDQIDDMFNDFFKGTAIGRPYQDSTSLDIFNEDDKRLVVEAHAPGFEEKDIDISLQNGVLEIRGRREEKAEEGDKKRGYMVRESSASFYRRIALPDYIDENSIDAELDKGILRIKVPFAERPQPKRIKVKSSSKKSSKK